MTLKMSGTQEKTPILDRLLWPRRFDAYLPCGLRPMIQQVGRVAEELGHTLLPVRDPATLSALALSLCIIFDQV